jgi:hypothetical protein
VLLGGVDNLASCHLGRCFASGPHHHGFRSGRPRHDIGNRAVAGAKPDPSRPCRAATGRARPPDRVPSDDGEPAEYDGLPAADQHAAAGMLTGDDESALDHDLSVTAGCLMHTGSVEPPEHHALPAARTAEKALEEIAGEEHSLLPS